MMAESLEEPSFSESSGFEKEASGFEKYRSHQHFDVLFDELEALRGLLDTVKKWPEISLFRAEIERQSEFLPASFLQLRPFFFIGSWFDEAF